MSSPQRVRRRTSETTLSLSDSLRAAKRWRISGCGEAAPLPDGIELEEATSSGRLK